MQFVNHLFKELVDESVPDVALTGCCKIIQKLNFCLLLEIKYFPNQASSLCSLIFLTCSVIKQELL